MRQLLLGEHQNRSFAAIPAGTGRALATSGLARIATQYGTDRTVLRAGRRVGSFRVGTGDGTTELHVRPKVGVPRLLWFLAYAPRVEGWQNDPVNLDVASDLETAVAIWFTRRVEVAIAPGALHGYVTKNESLPTLRGRLREADQLRRHQGRLLPLEMTFDEYSEDIPENRMLRAAALRLRDLPRLPVDVRQYLYQLERTLAAVGALTRGAPLPEISETRLNRRYSPALQLARLVLTNHGIDADPRETPGHAFVFDMDKVFEAWLAVALGDALHPRGGVLRSQRELGLATDDGNGKRIAVRPDLTWWNGDSCVAVIDAKYKRLTNKGPAIEDVYQMLAYCDLLGLREGHLVYAAGGPERVLHHPRFDIHVHAMQIDQEIPQLLERIGRLGGQL